MGRWLFLKPHWWFLACINLWPSLLDSWLSLPLLTPLSLSSDSSLSLSLSLDFSWFFSIFLEGKKRFKFRPMISFVTWFRGGEGRRENVSRVGEREREERERERGKEREREREEERHDDMIKQLPFYVFPFLLSNLSSLLSSCPPSFIFPGLFLSPSLISLSSRLSSLNKMMFPLQFVPIQVILTNYYHSLWPLSLCLSFSLFPPLSLVMNNGPKSQFSAAKVKHAVWKRISWFFSFKKKKRREGKK